MASTPHNEEWQLVQYPDGMVQREHFQKVPLEMPSVQEGQLLIRALYISVDPYMRGRMTPPTSGAYFSSFKPGEVIDGTVVGAVEKSTVDGFATGDVVQGFFPWRRYFTVDAKSAQKVDTSFISPSAYLGILGLTGLSAYFPALEIAEPRSGDVGMLKANKRTYRVIWCIVHIFDVIM